MKLPQVNLRDLISERFTRRRAKISIPVAPHRKRYQRQTGRVIQIWKLFKRRRVFIVNTYISAEWIIFF